MEISKKELEIGEFMKDHEDFYHLARNVIYKECSLDQFLS